MNGFESLIYSTFLSLIVNIIASWAYPRIFSGKHLERRSKFIFFILLILCLYIVVQLSGEPQKGLDKERTDIPAAWNNKGYLLYEEGQFQKSIECYDRAIKLDPKYTLAINNKIDAQKALYRGTG